MSTYYHGCRESIGLHAGLCLVDREEIAEVYARRSGTVYEVAVDLSGLVVEEVEITADMRDDVEYPGDTEQDRAELIARGVDAITYDDETETGRQHRCLRLISPHALAAARVSE